MSNHPRNKNIIRRLKWAMKNCQRGSQPQTELEQLGFFGTSYFNIQQLLGIFYGVSLKRRHSIMRVVRAAQKQGDLVDIDSLFWFRKDGKLIYSMYRDGDLRQLIFSKAIFRQRFSNALNSLIVNYLSGGRLTEDDIKSAISAVLPLTTSY